MQLKGFWFLSKPGLWTGHGLDSGPNNGLDSWIGILIVRGQRFWI